MYTRINDIKNREEVLEVFEKIENEVRERVEREGYYTDYTESDIYLVDENDKDIKDFYKEVIKFGGEDRVVALVKTLIKFCGRYWKDSETPMGLDAAAALAFYDKKYIKLFKDYILSTDLDHEVYQWEYVIDVVEANGWNEGTFSLYVGVMYKSTYLQDAFPIESMVKHLKQNENDQKILKDIMKSEKKIAIKNSGNRDYFEYEYNNQNKEWLKRLEDALLPSPDEMIKIDVCGKKIFLDKKTPINKEELKDILEDVGAIVVDKIDDDTSLIVSNRQRTETVEIISYDTLFNQKAYKAFINQFKSEIKTLIREKSWDEVLKRLDKCKSLSRYVEVGDIFDYSSSLTLEFVKELVEKYGFDKIIKSETSKTYGILMSLYGGFENPKVLEIIEYLTDKNLLSYKIDEQIRLKQRNNYQSPIINVIGSLDEDLSENEVVLEEDGYEEEELEELKKERKEQLEKVKKRIDYLLKMGADLEDLYEGEPVLGYALNKSYANFAIMHHLMDIGADINYEYETYHHYSGELQWVKNYLVDAIFKARYEEPGHLDDEYDIAKDEEERDRYFGIIKKLVEKGIKLEHTKDYVPFFHAIDSNNIKVIEYLYEKGNYDVNEINKHNTHIINYAEGNIFALKFLLEKGSNVNGTGHKNRTVLFEAMEYGKVEIVKLLLEYGVDINHKDDEGLTAVDVMKNHYKKLENDDFYKYRPQIKEVAQLLGIEL